MNNSRINYDAFIIGYNELDNYMRKELDVDKWVAHTDLIRQISKKSKLFLRYRDDLLSFARLRNAIVHNPNKRNADPIAEPHDYVVEKYKRILKNVLSPPLALDTIAIREDNIYKLG